MKVQGWRIPDVEEGAYTEDEEAPLVGGGSQRADEAAYNNDTGKEGGGQDVGKGKAAREEEQDKEEREVDEPLDVAHILRCRLA